MLTAAECRTYAEDCERLARGGSPKHRAVTLAIAQAWRRVAEDLEHREDPMAGDAMPGSPRQLDASSVPALAATISRLRPGEQGWIALSAGQRLFSAMQADYAFGEMDEAGRTSISAFADRAAASFAIMPVEGRIYFTRS
jgi:hypothetical protein